MPHAAPHHHHAHHGHAHTGLGVCRVR